LPAPGTEVGDGKAGSAAKHTYDVGYKKWEKFDIDAALNENEDDADGEDIGEFNYENVSSNPVVEVVEEKGLKETLTPASLAMLAGSAASQVGAVQSNVPKARGVHHDKDAETAEREQGNKEFAAGQFPQAVKSYTKCLGLKKRNYIAFSNRAMAYLKLKEYIRAEVDCNSALTIEPSHVKSLVRRATARNALGKHRAALGDIYAAMELTEAAKGNVKQHRVDLQKTQELLRSCVSRAPMAKIQAKFADGDDQTGSVAGPDLPLA
jgi:tetratricopeptide (TPR) repeat protein